jgi:hypothetical protein
MDYRMPSKNFRTRSNSANFKIEAGNQNIKLYYRYLCIEDMVGTSAKGGITKIFKKGELDKALKHSSLGKHTFQVKWQKSLTSFMGLRSEVLRSTFREIKLISFYTYLLGEVC